MRETQIDVAAFVGALDAQRQAKGISWRELARQTGVTASTFTRMRQGKRPDVNTFGALLQWLKLPAEDFMESRVKGRKGSAEPHPLAVASTLLRGKKKMSPEGMAAIENLVRAAYKVVKELK